MGLEAPVSSLNTSAAPQLPFLKSSPVFPSEHYLVLFPMAKTPKPKLKITMRKYVKKKKKCSGIQLFGVFSSGKNQI